MTEAATRDALQENVFLEISQNSQENTSARVSILIKLLPETWSFIKMETLAQVLSCEFCKIYKNTFFTKHVWATASYLIYLLWMKMVVKIITKIKGAYNFTKKCLRSYFKGLCCYRTSFWGKKVLIPSQKSFLNSNSCH